MENSDQIHFVYIIQSVTDNSFYIGYSKDPLSRLEKHNRSNTGYTATKKPWALVYTEKYSSKTEALIREKFIKRQKSKVFIQGLVDK